MTRLIAASLILIGCSSTARAQEAVRDTSPVQLEEPEPAIAPEGEGGEAADAAEEAGVDDFEEEFALSLRAGRGELSDSDREALLKQNHPILMQIGDANTLPLIQLFANLPDTSHKELVDNGYLKWDFPDLDEKRRGVFQEMIRVNRSMIEAQGMSPHPEFSLEELEKAQVGLAVVDIPEAGRKVVSVFILWPNTSDPTWVTVVNGRAAGTPAYFQAHMQRLPLLKAMPKSTPLGKGGAEPTHPPNRQAGAEQSRGLREVGAGSEPFPHTPDAAPAGQPGPVPDAWWDDRTAGLFGGIGGSIIGCLGALMGTLASLGKGRRLVLSLAIAMPFCGAACLVLGIVALGAGQPYAVYSPLLLGGIIMTAVFAGCLPTVRRRYEEIELRKMTAMDVGARN